MKLVSIHRILRKDDKGHQQVVEPRQPFTTTQQEGEQLIAAGAARDPDAGPKAAAKAVRVNPHQRAAEKQQQAEAATEAKHDDGQSAKTEKGSKEAN